MEFTFINIITVYVLLMVTYICKVITDRIKVLTYNPLIESCITDAIQYTKNITYTVPGNTHFIDFRSLNIDDQNKFVSHAIGFMKLNYKNVLSEMGIDSDEKICSLIVSKIK